MKFFLSLLLYFFVNNSDAYDYQNDTNILEIHFQDFFQQDTLDISIDNCYELNGVILNSNTVTGTTGIVLSITVKHERYVIESFKGKKECEINPNMLNITISLNKKIMKYKIDATMGRYVGFNKKNAGLLLRQSKKRFLYD